MKKRRKTFFSLSSEINKLVLILSVRMKFENKQLHLNQADYKKFSNIFNREFFFEKLNHFRRVNLNVLQKLTESKRVQKNSLSTL
jgi:hypothetical protein